MGSFTFPTCETEGLCQMKNYGTLSVCSENFWVFLTGRSASCDEGFR